MGWWRGQEIGRFHYSAGAWREGFIRPIGRDVAFPTVGSGREARGCSVGRKSEARSARGGHPAVFRQRSGGRWRSKMGARVVRDGGRWLALRDGTLDCGEWVVGLRAAEEKLADLASLFRPTACGSRMAVGYRKAARNASFTSPAQNGTMEKTEAMTA